MTTADNSFDILATSHDERVHVMKDGDAFAIFDRKGDVRPMGGMSTQGLYVADTRFLSRCTLTLEGQAPLLLSSTISGGGAILVIDLTNTDVTRDGVLAIPHGALHLCRTLVIHEGVLRQKLKVTSFANEEVTVTISLDVAADFADVFEVRGHKRARRGTAAAPEATTGRLTLGYVGLDGIERKTVIRTSPACAVSPSKLTFRVTLPPHRSQILYVTARCIEAGRAPRRRSRTPLMGDACTVSSTSAGLDAWLQRSRSDLRMMLTRTAHGPYPYAGVPWFSTVFGRDGIITALETLWLDPSIARGVLAFLAATQATEVDPARDAEPGKIVHELRSGEMANLGEVPFGRYYGSVDATPLFVVLAGAYLTHTGDLATAAELWPHVDAAMRWLEQWGDADKDGFVEYRSSPRGLVHQGWKDSSDSVFHADGAPPSGGVALCEVQGYVYAAHRAAATLARALGRAERAVDEDKKADALRAHFDEVFWDEELGTYGLAVDGARRLCRVRSSNAGHCLWSGIARPERSARIAATLLDPTSFSGWGVRTLAASTLRYNPMAYHNGSIWPHDNAIVAAGLAAYGHKREAVRVFSALLDVSKHVELQRVPELFCGFTRARGKGPTLYPVACSPQSWAAGSVFLVLQACLGLSVDAIAKRVLLSFPHLPPNVRELEITGLRVGRDASVDLALHRYPDGVGVDVRARRGDVEVVMCK